MGSDVGCVWGREQGHLADVSGVVSDVSAGRGLNNLTTSRKTSPTPQPSSSIAFSSLDTSMSDRTARSEMFLNMIRTSLVDSGGSDAGHRESCVNVEGVLGLGGSSTKIK